MQQIYILEHFYIYPSMFKCINLLKCKNVDVSGKLGLFLNNVLVMFHWNSSFISLVKYLLYRYYNKNKWVSDHSVEIMWIVFA